MGRNIDKARDQAWATFGARNWVWFVYGPIMFKVFGVLVLVGGFVAGIWLGNAFLWPWVVSWGVSLAFAVSVGIGLAIYAALAIVSWRIWQHDLIVHGLNRRVFSAGVMCVALFTLLCIGVSL